jgi:hypothetical protein
VYLKLPRKTATALMCAIERTSTGAFSLLILGQQRHEQSLLVDLISKLN